MKEEQNRIDRRNFLKTVGAAGLGSVLVSKRAIAGPNQSNAEDKPKYPQVPKRKLGKTGVEVPSLSLGVFVGELTIGIPLIAIPGETVSLP